MKKINALELRQSLGKIIALIQRTGEPIMLEKGRKEAAVIISIKDYNERFVEKAASDERQQIFTEILGMARQSSNKQNSEELIRELRA